MFEDCLRFAIKRGLLSMRLEPAGELLLVTYTMIVKLVNISFCEENDDAMRLHQENVPCGKLVIALIGHDACRAPMSPRNHTLNFGKQL